MTRPITRVATVAALALVPTAACELEEPLDVMGNYEVVYADNLRVYINDTLVAEVESGEDATIEYNGETFQVSTLCSDEGTECPAETYWGEIAVDQPWGTEYNLLNFVNLDTEHGTPGQRMGGTLDNDRSFTMLSGLGLSGNGNCAAIGVGTVVGQFTEDASEILDGMLVYEWAGGCSIDGVDIGVALRLETDVTAVRTGDYDVSSVTPEEPIDEDGQTVDPDEPQDGHSLRAFRD